MVYWVIMLIVTLIIPALMFGIGLYFVKNPPKSINALYGYRTKRSMKNQDTWDFAHRHCGKVWFRAGIVLAPVSIISMLFIVGKEILTVATIGLLICCIQAVIMLFCIIPTERALMKHFDEDGNQV